MSRLVVVAPRHDIFTYWCRHENDPPLRPTDRNIIPVTSAFDAERRLRGTRPEEGDRLEILGWPTRYQDGLAIEQMLRATGWWDVL